MHLDETKSIVLIVEDDANDALMLKRAIQNSGLNMPIYHCSDGGDAMEYLRGKGKYADRKTFPFPRLLVMDLKIPRCDGFEILEWLQTHPECNLIPKIVLSVSNEESDVIRAYQLGVNCYFMKPSNMSTLNKIVQAIHAFWSLAEVPPLPKSC